MTHNRQTAKERSWRKDLDRERNRRIDAELVLDVTTAFVASDSAALPYQTLGQYRAAVLSLLNQWKPSQSPQVEAAEKV